jgi:hypothetical protein
VGMGLRQRKASIRSEGGRYENCLCSVASDRG